MNIRCSAIRDFRIFIDAATLKGPNVGGAVVCGMDFRIFIDAATLKDNPPTLGRPDNPPFPHLYRCGHIEGEKGLLPVAHFRRISASL